MSPYSQLEGPQNKARMSPYYQLQGPYNKVWMIVLVKIPPPPPLVLPHPLCFPRGGWGTVTCSTQNFSMQLTVLLWQNHHPRVRPKAFQWKVVSVCKSSRSSGAGPRKSPRREVVRSSAGAGVLYPPFLGSFA